MPFTLLQIARLERAVQTAEDASTNIEREAKNDKSNADKEIARYGHERKQMSRPERIPESLASQALRGPRYPRGYLIFVT